VEDADHRVSVHEIHVGDDAALKPRFVPERLGGVMVLEGTGAATDHRRWKGCLYRSAGRRYRPVPLRAVPYFAWDNRRPGGMAVWLPVTLGAPAASTPTAVGAAGVQTLRPVEALTAEAGRMLKRGERRPRRWK
jgi:hypothetical protein